MLWLAFILLGAGIAWLTVQFITAPEGYEDPERGFVLGPEPFQKPGARLADRDDAAPVSAPFHEATNG